MASAAEKTEDLTHDISDDLAALRADVASLSKAVAQLAKGEAETLKDAAATRVVALRDRAEEQVVKAKEAAGKAVAETEAQVHAHPFAAVAVSAAAGFLIGALARGRG